MTKEAALYKAKHLRKVHPSICIDAEDFWDTVIAALEQEPCDAVSRKAAIDACLKGLNRKEMVSNIKALPSVHPECTEDYCPAAFKPVECKDYISRQAAIDINENHHGQMPNHINHQIWQEIKDLPSVTPAEKVGHWVFVKGYEGILYECTVCRNKNTHTTVRWNYCPHCGVKMQEVEE